MVNSAIKLRLYPDRPQRAKLVASSKDERLQIAAGAERTRGRGEKDDTERPECEVPVYRSSKTMCAFFRNNKKALARHLQVQDEVRDSAFQDRKKAVKSSLALLFALKNKGQKIAFPDLKFKSKFAPSNSIEIRARSISVVQQGEKQLVRFNPTSFELGKNDGIQSRERLPELLYSAQLQRLREGGYYLVIPRTVGFAQSRTTRVCAIDPGVRNYHEVLLSAFQTSELARKYKQSAATDAAATVQPAGARMTTQAVKCFRARDDGSIPLQVQEPPKIQNGEVRGSTLRRRAQDART